MNQEKFAAFQLLAKDLPGFQERYAMGDDFYQLHILTNAVKVIVTNEEVPQKKMEIRWEREVFQQMTFERFIETIATMLENLQSFKG
ncbi:MAG TPA: hypothetical protein IAB04_06730 [Candidatus Avimonoglobus intestinipullorum]|uniref:Uncharacterized protein n=1 Tax=Candidatus Avimonoglobus intestinipullorum TaxID=2840699 RepID=A0A9D1S778_9FIRM|nr:hypothetical protein [Candidatus Avimonoglobus intestinipullorum]